MEIKVNIEAKGLEEAIKSLSEALTTGVRPAVEAEKKEEPAVAEDQQPEVEETKQQEPEPAPEVEKEAPKQETAEISLETVRVKLGELSQAGKQKQVKALIAEFDSSDRPKLSNVAKEDYAALLEKAGEL